jgi:hypothetical protein
MDTNKHGWGKTQRRRERGETRREKPPRLFAASAPLRLVLLSVSIRVYQWLIFLSCPVRFSRSATIVDSTMAIKTTEPMIISETLVGIGYFS